VPLRFVVAFGIEELRVDPIGMERDPLGLDSTLDQLVAQHLGDDHDEVRVRERYLFGLLRQPGVAKRCSPVRGRPSFRPVVLEHEWKSRSTGDGDSRVAPEREPLIHEGVVPLVAEGTSLLCEAVLEAVEVHLGREPVGPRRWHGPESDALGQQDRRLGGDEVDVPPAREHGVDHPGRVGDGPPSLHTEAQCRLEVQEGARLERTRRDAWRTRKLP